MKIAILILILPLAACHSYGDPHVKWDNMLIDIALRHKYEKYSCANELRGYSKDDCRISHAHRTIRHSESSPTPQRIVGDNGSERAQEAMVEATQRLSELNQKIEALQDAVKSNVAGSNQNQELIAGQINSMKSEIKELRAKQANSSSAQ